MQTQVIRIDTSRLQISGDLTFRTVMPVRQQLETLLAGVSGEQVISLANIGRVDSSALSLWLCIQRWARDRHLTLQVTDMPDEVRALGRLVGMERRWERLEQSGCQGVR